MPIEIRQLIIRASLTEEPDAPGPQTGAQARATGKNASKAEIVREAVEQVMQILKEEKER